MSVEGDKGWELSIGGRVGEIANRSRGKKGN